MPHIVGKLLTKVTTLFFISLQSKVCIKSYGPPKLRESQFGEFQDSQLGSPRVHASWLGIENTIKGKVVAFPKFGP
jgi:hypothetical protein